MTVSQGYTEKSYPKKKKKRLKKNVKSLMQREKLGPRFKLDLLCFVKYHGRPAPFKTEGECTDREEMESGEGMGGEEAGEVVIDM